MTVTPILIMASAVFAFIVVALTIGTVLGVALGQAKDFFQKKTQS